MMMERGIRIEDLGTPMQRFISSLSSELTEDDLQQLQQLSVKELALLYERLGAGEDANVIWEGMRKKKQQQHYEPPTLPLPEKWCRYFDDEKQLYYYVSPEGTSQWEFPKQNEKDELPVGWTSYVDEVSGQTYYCGPDGTVQWDVPTSDTTPPPPLPNDETPSETKVQEDQVEQIAPLTDDVPHLNSTSSLDDQHHFYPQQQQQQIIVVVLPPPPPQPQLLVVVETPYSHMDPTPPPIPFEQAHQYYSSVPQHNNSYTDIDRGDSYPSMLPPPIGIPNYAQAPTIPPGYFPMPEGQTNSYFTSTSSV
eukprot:PhF_6_TR34951/c2_g1_i8/m.50699